jgi:hypothetical protein
MPIRSKAVFTRDGPECRAIGSLRNERSLNSCGWRKINRSLVQYTQMSESFYDGLVEVAQMAGWLFLRITA